MRTHEQNQHTFQFPGLATNPRMVDVDPETGVNIDSSVSDLVKNMIPIDAGQGRNRKGFAMLQTGQFSSSSGLALGAVASPGENGVLVSINIQSTGEAVGVIEYRIGNSYASAIPFSLQGSPPSDPPAPPTPLVISLGRHAFGDERQPAADDSAAIQQAFAEAHDLTITRSEYYAKVPVWQGYNASLISFLWANLKMDTTGGGDSVIGLDAASPGHWQVGANLVQYNSYVSQHPSGIHDLTHASAGSEKAASASAKLAATGGSNFAGVFTDNSGVRYRNQYLTNVHTLIANSVTPVLPDSYPATDELFAVYAASVVNSIAAEILADHSAKMIINPGDLRPVNAPTGTLCIDYINSCNVYAIVSEQWATLLGDNWWGQVQASKLLVPRNLMHVYLDYNSGYFTNQGLRDFFWATVACGYMPYRGDMASIYPAGLSVANSRTAYFASLAQLEVERQRLLALGLLQNLTRDGNVVTAEFEGGTLTINIATRATTGW